MSSSVLADIQFNILGEVIINPKISEKITPNNINSMDITDDTTNLYKIAEIISIPIQSTNERFYDGLGNEKGERTRHPLSVRIKYDQFESLQVHNIQPYSLDGDNISIHKIKRLNNVKTDQSLRINFVLYPILTSLTNIKYQTLAIGDSFDCSGDLNELTQVTPILCKLIKEQHIDYPMDSRTSIPSRSLTLHVNGWTKSKRPVRPFGLRPKDEPYAYYIVGTDDIIASPGEGGEVPENSEEGSRLKSVGIVSSEDINGQIITSNESRFHFDGVKGQESIDRVESPVHREYVNNSRHMSLSNSPLDDVETEYKLLNILSGNDELDDVLAPSIYEGITNNGENKRESVRNMLHLMLEDISSPTMSAKKYMNEDKRREGRRARDLFGLGPNNPNTEGPLPPRGRDKEGKIEISKWDPVREEKYINVEPKWFKDLMVKSKISSTDVLFSHNDINTGNRTVMFDQSNDGQSKIKQTDPIKSKRFNSTNKLKILGESNLSNFVNPSTSIFSIPVESRFNYKSDNLTAKEQEVYLDQLTSVQINSVRKEGLDGDLHQGKSSSNISIIPCNLDDMSPNTVNRKLPLTPLKSILKNPGNGHNSSKHLNVVIDIGSLRERREIYENVTNILNT